jgi:ribose/xylose/arabinose/galactoside ABC-type transport system permease subunit
MKQNLVKTGKNFNWQTVILLGILAIVVAFFYGMNPRFLSAYNLANMSKHVSFVIISGCAVTLLMVAGGLDISMGSVMACTGVFCAYLSHQGFSTPAAFFLATGFGGFMGLINGFVVLVFRITPFIATLGMFFIARGFAFLLTGGLTIRDVADNFGVMGQSELGPFPYPFLITLSIVIVSMIFEKKHLIGKYAIAIGGNRMAADLSGIRTKSILMFLYILVGVFTGFAGVLLASRLGVGDPKLMYGFEFVVITAVIVGGTSLAGGEGTIMGMVIAACILQVINSGLNIMGVFKWWQQVVNGIVLVIFVYSTVTFKEKIKNR